MNAQALLAVLLAALCSSSAVAVAYAQHLSRQSYADIGGDRRAREELDVQWSRLQIEESTFSGHGRIERLARESLGMRLPDPEESVMITRRQESH